MLLGFCASSLFFALISVEAVTCSEANGTGKTGVALFQHSSSVAPVPLRAGSDDALKEDLTLMAALVEDELEAGSEDLQCNGGFCKVPEDQRASPDVSAKVPSVQGLETVEGQEEWIDTFECLTLSQDLILFMLAITGFHAWRRFFVEEAAEGTKTESISAPLASPTNALDTTLDVDAVVRAMYSSNKEDLRKFLDERSVNARDSVGCCTALHVAAHYNCMPAVEALLSRRADIDVRDAWDETPLHFAARAGHVEVCALLLKSGADVNAVNAQSWTPLLVAAESGKEEMCEMLLNHGAHTGGADEEEVPPLLIRLLSCRILKGALA